MDSETTERGAISFRGAAQGAEEDPDARASGNELSIHYGGRRYRCSVPQAERFVSRALRVAADHSAELVVLVHSEGADMLLITDRMPFMVGGIEHL